MLLPGAMGSVLIDSSLTPQQAQQLCRNNIRRVGPLLRGSALYPCDKGPERLWNGVGSLHWLFNPADWEQG